MWTQRFRDLVMALRRPDRVLFIASHNLDELQRISDRVAIIDRGRLQRVVDLKHRTRRLSGGALSPRHRRRHRARTRRLSRCHPAAPNEFDLPERSLEEPTGSSPN
jgi:ABC-type multidrug transport system ATPase subunit